MIEGANQQLDELIFALFDGTISKEEHHRLDEWLQSDHEALERYLSLVEIHNILELDISYDRDLISDHVVPVKTILRRQKRKTFWISTAAAALLMLGFSLFFSKYKPQNKTPLSKLSFPNILNTPSPTLKG